MATIVGSATGGNWSATTAWVGGVVPTIADDVQLNASTGPITVDGTSGVHSKCNSLDCTGYTGTLTWNSLYLDVFASLKLVSAMTLSGNAFVYFTGTGTTNTIDWAGHPPYAVTISGAGSWKLLSDMYMSSYASLTHNSGTFDMNGHNGSGGFASYGTLTRTFIWGSSTWSVSGSGTHFGWNGSNFTIDASAATFNFGGSSGGVQIDALGTSLSAPAVGTVNITSQSNLNATLFTITTLNISGACTLGGSGTVTTLNLLGGSTTTFASAYTIGTLNSSTTSLYQNNQLNVDLTVGNLTVNGANSAQRPFFYAQTRGTPRTITCNGTVSLTNCDFRDIVAAGSAAGWATGTTVGDCTGNTGIAFTAPASRTYNFGNGNFSNPGIWGGGVCPLPQDAAVFINSSFPASGKVATVDLPRIGTVDTSACTNPGTVSFGGVTCYGSLIRGTTSGVAFSGNGSVALSGLGTHYINTSYSDFQINIDALTGTYQVQQDYLNRRNLDGAVTVTSGTLDMNGYALSSNQTGAILRLNGGTLILGSSVAFPFFASTSTSIRTLTMNSCAVVLNGTGTVWNITATNLTLSRGTSTITISDTTATAKAFAGGGMTYYALALAAATGNGAVTISGSNTFNALNLLPYASVLLTAGTTQTLQTPPTWHGQAGAPVTVASTSATLTAAVACSIAGVDCDYLALTRISASGTNFYAGSNANDNGGNVNWIFNNALKDRRDTGPSGSRTSSRRMVA